MLPQRMAAIREAVLKIAEATGGIEAVFLRHRSELLRFLRARAPSEDAEDLAQELWVRVQSVSSGPIADPLPYLYRMANNLALDMGRSASRRRRRDHEWASDGGDHDFVPQISGERIVMARDKLRMVEAKLAGLGERTWTILRMFRVQGIPQERIAAELGISLSAVEKHLQKAYRALLSIDREDDDDRF